MENNIEIKAKAKYLKISPRKLREVLIPISGMDVEKALNYLESFNKKATQPVIKLLNSAVANAKHNFNLPQEGLFIKEIIANEGPTLKRWRTRAMGRMVPIRKRSSHLSVILSLKEDFKGKEIPKQALTEAKPAKKKKEVPRLSEEKGKIKKEPKPKEIFDVRRKGKHRHEAHIDTITRQQKDKGLKRFFRRKAI